MASEVWCGAGHDREFYENHHCAFFTKEIPLTFEFLADVEKHKNIIETKIVEIDNGISLMNWTIIIFKDEFRTWMQTILPRTKFDITGYGDAVIEFDCEESRILFELKYWS